MATSRLEFRILGPLAVRVDDTPVPIGGPKQRALLALLLLSANRVVSRERLIGELFSEQSVNSADHALRNHVSSPRPSPPTLAATRYPPSADNPNGLNAYLCSCQGQQTSVQCGHKQALRAFAHG